MKSLLLLGLVAAAPVAAQSDAPLARTAATFEADLADLARLATAAALVHERTGAFPATPFGLLGAPESGQTGARAFPLSELSVAAAGDSLTMRYVPLPVSPYTRDDLVVAATVRPDAAGRYTVTHEMRRREDADDGARALLYDRVGAYHVGKGFGQLCIDPAAARRMIADGTYSPGNRPQMALNATYGDLQLRVHPPGEAEPVFFEARTQTVP